MAKNLVVSTEEAPFSFDELFYSKTDLKGIILAGNSVFQRVAEYSWADILNKPHNIIRHPDMPRAVFYLLWKFLKEDKPIGAFVKNRSKSGKYYWVYALALPVPGGFLSVRMKPGGALLDLVEKEYKELRKLELANQSKPEDSAGILAGKLTALGFPEYSDFMTDALIDQLSNRANQMNLPLPNDLKIMTEVKTAGLVVVEASQKILQAFITSKYVPINLEIFSNRRGEEGQQVAVVADQYRRTTEEIAEDIRRFTGMAESVAKKITASQFQVGSAVLLTEIQQYLKNENSAEKKNDLDEIDGLVNKYLENAFNSVKEIADVVREFSSICEKLNSLGLGLELVRITGKIELSRMEGATEALVLLDGLREFQNSLKSGLAEILEINNSISGNTRGLVESLFKKLSLKK